MPRARTLALAAFVSLVSLGLASGLAYRWLLRDARLQNAEQAVPLGTVLRPRGDEGRAILWGFAFLPVFWGGLLTLLSPLALMGEFETAAFVLPWVLTLVLSVYMRWLYLRPTLLASGADEDVDPLRAGPLAAWGRHLKVALWCGVPGLLLCTVCVAGAPRTEPLAVLALLALPPAVLGPWIGALSALPILARAGGLATREVQPTTPGGLRRLAVGAAAVALGTVWLIGARTVVARAGDPLLSDEDFSRIDTCYGSPGYSMPMAGPPDPQAVRARLLRAGVSCGSLEGPVGELALGDQLLAWCVPSSEDEPELVRLAQVVALDPSNDRVIARRELVVASLDPRPTSAGVLAATWDEDGRLRLVRIGKGARVEAKWRAPTPPHAGSTNLLVVDRTGSVAFAWESRPGRVALTWLTGDLEPVGRPTVVSAAGPSTSLTLGEAACLHLYDGRKNVALVLDRDGEVRRPALAERLAARAGSAFHLGWTGLVLGLLGAIALGAAHTRRRFSRAVAAGTCAEGTLSPTDDGAAILRRSDGEVARVRTAGAAWHGFADGEAREGPCLIFGAGAAAGAGAYRSAPPEIDAASGFGIVRGDLAQAHSWATLHRDRIVATVVAVGWLVAGPALLALWI